MTQPNNLYGWKNYNFLLSTPIRYENLIERDSSHKELNKKLEYSIWKLME